MKLICFPHAGGFSLYYAFLRKYAYQNIERVLVFDYLRDRFVPDGTSADFQLYIDAAAGYIESSLAPGEPYLLLGHSMGAFVACEAGLILQNGRGNPPAGVIVSGQNPPYAVCMGRHTEIPKDLYEFAKKLGGVPQKILDHPEMCEKLYRLAEQDMKAVAQYVPAMPEPECRLACGLLLRGAEDCIVDPALTGEWSRTFRRMYADQVFPGGHFYFNLCAEKFSAWIDRFAGYLADGAQ